MSNKAEIAALDDLILRCEKTMLSPFAKRPVEAAEKPTEAAESTEASTIDDQLTEDEADLAKFYEEIGD
tara:strand:- start:9619 stop:9825 length:207 start_codon:yes stop_codon:yes gene_type:complete